MPPPPMPPPSNGGKVTPNLSMDAEGTRLLNLTVLQCLDPAVEDILITAAHVTLYDFNIDLNQWSRKDVEGSLFVVKRNTQPRFQFIIMNRRNTDNLVEDLLSDFEYELQPPYLLYRNAAQEVNGIWFYNQQDCDAVANLFGRHIIDGKRTKLYDPTRRRRMEPWRRRPLSMPLGPQSRSGRRRHTRAQHAGLRLPGVLARKGGGVIMGESDSSAYLCL